MPSAVMLNAAAARARVTFRVVFMSCTSSRGKSLLGPLYPFSRRFEPADMGALAHFVAMHIPADGSAGGQKTPFAPLYATV